MKVCISSLFPVETRPLSYAALKAKELVQKAHRVPVKSIVLICGQFHCHRADGKISIVYVSRESIWCIDAKGTEYHEKIK
jgi:vancomycin permeability regulator SanA